MASVDCGGERIRQNRHQLRASVNTSGDWRLWPRGAITNPPKCGKHPSVPPNPLMTFTNPSMLARVIHTYNFNQQRCFFLVLISASNFRIGDVSRSDDMVIKLLKPRYSPPNTNHPSARPECLHQSDELLLFQTFYLSSQPQPTRNGIHHSR